MATEPDYAVELNNFLQKHETENHETENLTPFFQYVMTKEGRDDSPTHIATAKFRGVPYAEGRGTSKGAAKRDAARQVLDYFRENGVPGPA